MALRNIIGTFGIIRVCQFSKDIIPASVLLKCRNVNKVSSLTTSEKVCTVRLYNADKKSKVPGKLPNPNSAEPPKKRKPQTSPHITLIQPDEIVTSVTLEQAEKLAKRRDLKLVKIVDFDTKTEKPVYRLMSSLEFFQEEKKFKEKKKKAKDSAVKDSKLLLVSSKIQEFDLSHKINQSIKLLKKNHGVNFFISQDGDPSRAEKVADVVKDELKEKAVLKNQTRKLTTLKLFFSPILNEENKDDNVNTKEGVENDKSKKQINETDKVKNTN